MKKNTFLLLALFSLGLFANCAFADLKVGDEAPAFELPNQNNEIFKLQDQKGKWSVLYFYPKADTPGCTKQACAFRDNIKKITELGTDVYGISTNDVKEQLEFYNKNKINFPLLADHSGSVAKLYGTKMPILNISKRWTFIIDDKLIIRDIARDVDPLLDAQRVANKIKELKK